MNTMPPTKKPASAKRPPALSRPPEWKPYHSNPFKPANVNHPDRDFSPPLAKRPPVPPYDTQAEIRAMAERLRWLCANDNDAPRLMRGYIDELTYEQDSATDFADDLEAAEKKIEEAEELDTKRREHIAGLIDLIDNYSENLTAEEREDPENVTCFLDAYAKHEAEVQHYITDNGLRQ